MRYRELAMGLILTSIVPLLANEGFDRTFLDFRNSNHIDGDRSQFAALALAPSCRDLFFPAGYITPTFNQSTFAPQDRALEVGPDFRLTELPPRPQCLDPFKISREKSWPEKHPVISGLLDLTMQMAVQAAWH